MQKFLVFLVMLALGAYAAACLALFVMQRSLIYYPPASAAFPAPHTSTLEVPGASLKVSERPAKGHGAVIYLGGNAEDVTASLPLLDAAYPDRALYLLHYRGYAGSTGKPAEEELVHDALALFDKVAPEHGDIVVVGRSLGTGVAVQLATQRPVRRLVLVTPFDSLRDLAARQFPYFPVRWLLRDRYDSWRHAPKVTAPTLLLVAGNDELIPRDSADQLLTRFSPNVATMRVIDGAGHNTISNSPDYIKALAWAR
ncbi:alpha/beta hydrolase [Massilia agri]|uniref:Lysophospholipase n=1 Tax=Massilia agri TaxID=1886785 RepID=A0ABT2AJU0_9BURK|nr:lysophospholipase [Massilia agri]MCS0596496.1 lysophospholipase [Massilia agri]